MPRLRRPPTAAPYGAALFAAACAVLLGVGHASGQVAVGQDPLAPKLQTDPRQPPRFQKFSRPALVQLGPPATFVVPPSAAGDTGFDSTNSREAQKKTGTKTKPGAKANAAAPAPTVSPYQKPFKASGNGAYAAASATPPAELGAIRKPPPKRKAHSEPEDPYTPLGLRAGAFTLFPAIEISGGYATNPQQSASAKGAWLYAVAPELKVQSNWSRHELKADLRGSFTGYNPDTEPTLSRPYSDSKVDGRIDVTKDTRIDLNGHVLVSTDNPGSPNLQAGLAELPMFVTYGGRAGLGQRFNRFDVSIKADAERTAYQNSTLTDGSTVSNDDRNYNQYGVTLRGGYERLPGVTHFVEARVDTRRHDLDVDSSGYQRNSKGLTGQIGTTFELSRLLTGEISAGYTRRNYDDPRLDQLSGFIGNASLIWTANALTTVKFTTASAIGESTIAGVSGVFYRDAGVQIDHSFRRWLIGSVKLGFGLDNYSGSGGTAADRVDKRFSAGLGLTYKLNRTTQLKGEFRQNWLRSNVSGADYADSVFMLGLRIQR